MLLNWNIERTGITKKSKEGDILYQCVLTIYSIDKMLKYVNRLNIGKNYYYRGYLLISNHSDFIIDKPLLSYFCRLTLNISTQINKGNKFQQIIFLTENEYKIVVDFFRRAKKYKLTKKDYITVFSKQEQTIVNLKNEIRELKQQVKTKRR